MNLESKEANNKRLSFRLANVELNRGEQLQLKAEDNLQAKEADNTSVLIVKSGCILIGRGSDRQEVFEGQTFITNGSIELLAVVAKCHSTRLKLICFDTDLLFSLNLSESLLLNLHSWFLDISNKYFISYNENILEVADLLETVLENNFGNPMNEEALLCAFKVMIYETIGLLRTDYINVNSSRQLRLYSDFYYMLRRNYRKEHMVSFYADKLFVTSRHLSMVIKNQSGKTASALIESFIVQDARGLLERNKLSIAQIADKLNFSDQVHFGKYFKRITGLSPKNFRNRLLLPQVC
jgi:AraC-like DNA-binding protein